MQAPDYYELLQVSPKADTAVILAAYKNLARRYHPDLHRGDPNAEQRMKWLNEAKDVLGDPQRRRAYDARLAAAQTEQARQAQAEAARRAREAHQREQQAQQERQRRQEEEARRLQEEQRRQAQQRAEQQARQEAASRQARQQPAQPEWQQVKEDALRRLREERLRQVRPRAEQPARQEAALRQVRQQPAQPEWQQVKEDTLRRLRKQQEKAAQVAQQPAQQERQPRQQPPQQAQARSAPPPARRCQRRDLWRILVQLAGWITLLCLSFAVGERLRGHSTLIVVPMVCFLFSAYRISQFSEALYRWVQEYVVAQRRQHGYFMQDKNP